MQAEHIPVHLGAMPAAVAAVLDEDHAAGRRRGSSTTPTRAAPTCPTSRSSRRVFDDGELLGFAASRAHHADVGGRVPGSMPADSTHAGRGGRRHRAARARRRGDRRAGRADAPARAAARRPARPARRQPRRRPARWASWPIASGSSSCARRRPRSSTTPSGARARASPTSTTGRAPPSTCSRRPTATSSCAWRATVDGDELTLDFSGSAAQHDGNLNCPLAVTASACLLRRARAHRPRHPAQRGRLPADHGDRARGLAAQRAPARRRRRRQRRDLLARGRPRARRLRPRARPGHDEQPHARQRRFDLLRDARRRPGRVRGRRRAQRRARRDVEHAQHAGRGARARVPAAGDRVRAAPRLGRRRAPPRRRRRRARARGARPT